MYLLLLSLRGLFIAILQCVACPPNLVLVIQARMLEPEPVNT